MLGVGATFGIATPKLGTPMLGANARAIGELVPVEEEPLGISKADSKEMQRQPPYKLGNLTTVHNGPTTIVAWEWCARPRPSSSK